MEKKTYITFALPLVKQLYLEHQPTKVKQEILLFAINARALQYNVKVKDVVEEVIYDATMSRDRMSTYIYDTLEEFKDLDEWEGQQIFNDGQEMDLSLVPEERDYVQSILEEKDEDEKDDQFIDDAYLFAKRRRAIKDMELNMPEWWEWSIIEPFASLYQGQVPVSISIERLVDWNIGTEYDRVKLGVYLAVRSLAKDGVAVTTLQAIKWRSLGCRNNEEFAQVLRNKQLQSIVDKYHTRYYFAKILADLQDSKLIFVLGRQHHTFVSASILDEQAFAEAVVDKIQRISAKAKEKQVSAQRKQVNTTVNEMLNKLRN